MTLDQKTVEQYIDGFNKSDHDQILACLTDDVEWLMPGGFHLTGKEAFGKEIENPAFTGRPTVTIQRMIENDDIVVAAKIRRLITYLVQLND